MVAKSTYEEIEMKSLSTIAALAFVGLSLAAALPAQAVDTVRIEDEPARNPYQQTAQVSNGCQINCTALFAAVPASKTLRITYISCTFTLSDASGLRLVALGNGQNPQTSIYIPLIFQAGSTTTGYFYVASPQVNLYATGGSVPNLYVLASETAFTDGGCTISGYTV
jgi:hypothetical protein